MTKVGIGVRFVPAGWQERDKQWLARGTLVLSPVIAPQPDETQVELEQWPQQIEDFFCHDGQERGAALAISPVGQHDQISGRPAPALPETPITALRSYAYPAAKHAKSIATRAADRKTMVSLWERLLSGGSEQRWVELVAALSPAQSKFDKLAHDDQPQVPNVLPSGRADLGIVLALDRAGSLIERMRKPDATPHADDPRVSEALRTRPRRNAAPAWLAAAINEIPDPTEIGSSLAARDRERRQIAEAGLSESRQQAAAKTKTRAAYRNAGSGADLATALSDLGGVKAGMNTPAALAALLNNHADLQAVADQIKTLHYAAGQYQPKQTDPLTSTDQQLVEEARTRFFGLQSDPILARLFNLAVDVVIPYAQLANALSGGWGLDETGDGLTTKFAFVTAWLGDKAPARKLWTCSKVRLARPERPANADLFWPCTREELDARAIGWDADAVLSTAIPAQMDGLVTLGAAQAGGTNPRFDIVTFDLSRAGEADLDADARALWSDPSRSTRAYTMASGGLLVVDRWRQYHALAQAADGLARKAKPTSDVVIDAEDLTVGMRMDVATDTEQGKLWRSLMERRISFDGELTRLIETLLPDEAERHHLEAAALSASARIQSDAAGNQTAFVEEVVAQWRGPPLGVDMHAAPVTLSAGALQVSRTYSLPTTGERPPRQAFGWGHHVGLRVQYAGGVARSLADARRAYGTKGGPFALPRIDGKPRRLLRHERIEAPLVATPLQILRRHVSGPAETAANLVVRTSPGKRLALTPATTFRVLVPPAVSLEFADRHDVFEPAMAEPGPGRTVRPRGGLRDLDYDRQHNGTFPVWSVQATSLGEIYPDDDHQPAPSGDAVFRPIPPGTDPRGRPGQYYPDPAADLMVFLLREPGGAALPGPPLVVRTRQPKRRYPDVTPIALELVALGSSTPGPATQSRLGLDLDGTQLASGGDAWITQPKPVFLDEGCGIHRTHAPGRVEAIRVALQLQPGERYELDIWCLPSVEALLEWFELVESSALVTQAKGGAAGQCLRGNAFAAAAAAACNVPLAQAQAGLGTAAPGPDGCGVGQLPLPGEAELGCMASLIQAKAKQTVTPELAARTTFTVTHAIDQPVLAPSMATQPAKDPPPKFGLVRVDNERRKQLLTGAADAALLQSVAGGTDVVLFGNVGVDFRTTGFVEVQASGPDLATGRFDDKNRGRSTDDQARGIWPENAEASRVFGFTLADDDTVTLIDQPAVLLRIEPVQSHPARPGVLENLDLLACQRFVPPPSPTGVKADAAPGVSYPFKIADTKARVLDIRLIAGSRTAPLVSDRNGDALPPSSQVLQSPAIRVALPATKRPARVEPLTILPAFRLEPFQQTTADSGPSCGVRRKVRLRVRVRRPWFSAGAGERLGVVLWPPSLFDDVVLPDSNRVKRGYDTVNGEESPTIDMSSFSDRDLGPGGAFVSRWGADPINPGHRYDGWLMPPEAFADVSQAAIGPRKPGQLCPRKTWDLTAKDADQDEVVYVPRARMPIPLAPGEQPPPGETLTLDVALLTFRPRFDLDRQNWYFDIDLNSQDVPEPFVRLGLVRYQANAMPELRVSEPVVEWAQIPPDRELTVTPVAGRKGVFTMVVAVSGPGWASAADAEHVPVRAKPGPADLGDGTLMRFVVYRREADGVETVASMVTQDEPAPADQTVRPYASSRVVTWETSFAFRDDPFAPSEPGVSYSVVATERRVMRPATPAAEPYDPDLAETDDEVVTTGPRFAARVVLPAPGAALHASKLKQARVLMVHSDRPDDGVGWECFDYGGRT